MEALTVGLPKLLKKEKTMEKPILEQALREWLEEKAASQTLTEQETEWLEWLRNDKSN